MIISYKYKFIFIKTARTAGTSIEVYLSKYCGPKDILTPFSLLEIDHIPRNYKGFFNPIPEIIKISQTNNKKKLKEIKKTIKDFLAKKKFEHHTPAWLVKERISGKIWKNYFKFCVERNPWDKVVSGWNWYNFKYSKKISFDEYLIFCKKRILAQIRGVGVCPFNIVNYTDPLSGKVIVDKIIRYEELEKQLAIIFNNLGIPINDLLKEHCKSGLRNDNCYQNIYSNKQRLLVEELFRKEIDLHGYIF